MRAWASLVVAGVLLAGCGGSGPSPQAKLAALCQRGRAGAAVNARRWAAEHAQPGAPRSALYARTLADDLAIFQVNHQVKCGF